MSIAAATVVHATNTVGFLGRLYILVSLGLAECESISQL